MIVPEPMSIDAEQGEAVLKLGDTIGELRVYKLGGDGRIGQDSPLLGDGFGYRILGPDGDELETGEDLRCPMAKNYGEPMSSLLSFLSAAAESYAYKMHYPDRDPENLDLFQPATVEWAYQNSDELAMAQMELDGEEEES